MDTPRIHAVKPLDGKRLLVTFVNGVEKIYDCNPIIQSGRFQLLGTEAFFKAVHVDSGGYGISWNDDIDLSEYELWHNGVGGKQVDSYHAGDSLSTPTGRR